MARARGIHLLDTAPRYGDAEACVGDLNSGFGARTKGSASGRTLGREVWPLESSLLALRRPVLDEVLSHTPAGLQAHRQGQSPNTMRTWPKASRLDGRRHGTQGARHPQALIGQLTTTKQALRQQRDLCLLSTRQPPGHPALALIPQVLVAGPPGPRE